MNGGHSCSVPAGHHCVNCCYLCADLPRIRAGIKADERRHAQQLQDKTLAFVVLTKVHHRSCPSVTAAVNYAMHGETDEMLHDGHRPPGFPVYVDRDTAAASERGRCRVCCPDLPAPYERRKDPMRSKIRCTGTGWPLADNTCARSHLSPWSRRLSGLDVKL